MLNLQLSTIIFQILNFLILLVVLTRFLYRPVLRTMHQRQEAIAARLRDADERGRQADAERERLAQQGQDAKAQAELLLTGARSEAAAERARLLEGARQDAARFHDEAERAIREQERSALGRLERQLGATAVKVAGSLIRQAAGLAVHEALIDRLVQSRIETTGADDDALRRALTAVDSLLVVELAYPASPELQARLNQAIASRLAQDGRTPEVVFRVESELLAGARIVAGHQVVVDLSLQRTLADLQRSAELE
jgi:F-type H+-transporting ATPase subunit b